MGKYEEAIKLIVMVAAIGVSFGINQSQIATNKEDIKDNKVDIKQTQNLATENAKDMGIVKTDIDYIKNTSEKTYDLVYELSSRN